MQLYHHPYSLDSQRARLALEEKGTDYTSFHVNPITGKNMDSSFFRMNPSAKLPVLQNGSHVIFDTMEIMQYIERIAAVSSGGNGIILANGEVDTWMKKIQAWNHNIFTLFHVPENHRIFVSRFRRRVIIARMAEFPDLASAYHHKLREAYNIEDELRDVAFLKASREHLDRLLDEVEAKLNKTTYLGGEQFSMADVMLIPVLARLVLLKLHKEYIVSRPSISVYWTLVQQRPSFEKVIGRHFNGWRKYKTLVKTWWLLHIRNAVRSY